MSRLTKQEIKEDAFLEGIYDLWEKVRQNSGLVLGITGALVVIVAGAFLWSRAQETREAEARTVLAEASTNYWEGNYPRTVQLADQVMADAGGTHAALDAMRLKADALFWQGAFDSAATLYQDILARNRKDGPLRTAVKQSLAFALESNKDPAGAAALYEEIAAAAPDRTNAADFQIAAGRAWRAAGQADKARAAFTKVATDYRETTFARDAEVALGELEGEAH